jgi:hypothetical protein
MLKKMFFLQNLQRLLFVSLHGTRWSPLLRWSSRIPRSLVRARRSARSQGITVRTRASVPRVWKVASSTSQKKCIYGRPKWNPCVTSSASITMSCRCVRRRVLPCDVFFVHLRLSACTPTTADGPSDRLHHTGSQDTQQACVGGEGPGKQCGFEIQILQEFVSENCCG